MKEIKISANQLATFNEVTEAKKKSIIRQQKKPNPIIVARYGLARARIRKAYKEKGDLTSVLEGIEVLKNRIPDTDWKRNDKMVSIEAMNRFLRMKLPDFLIDVPYEIIKRPKISWIIINGVKVVVSPDLIVKIKIDDKIMFGAIKIRIAKSSFFTKRQSQRIATLIHKYLEEVVAKDDEVVHKGMCLAIDVFQNTAIQAPPKTERTINEIKNSCNEVKFFWSKVA